MKALSASASGNTDLVGHLFLRLLAHYPWVAAPKSASGARLLIITLVFAQMTIPSASQELGVAQTSASEIQTLRSDGRLKPGAFLRSPLGAGRGDSYEVTLRAGEYLAVTAEPVAIDITLSFFDPGGSRILQLQSPYGTQEPVFAFVVAQRSGKYSLQVEATEPEAPAGTYELSVAALRASTDSDLQRLEAEIKFGEGQKAVALGTEDSKKKATVLYEEALALWRSGKDRLGEAETLSVLASLANDRGDNQKALELLSSSLQIFKSLGDRRGEALVILQNAGVQKDLGDDHKASELANQALSVRQDLNDSRGVAEVFEIIGVIHDDAAEYDEALGYYNRGLSLARANHDRGLESSLLLDIGVTQYNMDKDQQALEYYSQALPLARVLKDHLAEAKILSSMSSAYDELGERTKAIEYALRALELKRVAGNQVSLAFTLGNLGWQYLHLGEKQRALDCFLEEVSVTRKSGDERGLAIGLSRLGSVYARTGDQDQALRYYQEALSHARNVKDKSWEAIILGNMGFTSYGKRDLRAALEWDQLALPIMKETSNHDGEASVLNNLGKVYSDLGDLKKAREYFDQTLSIARDFKLPSWEAFAIHNTALLQLKTGQEQEALYNFSVAAHLANTLSDKELEASAVYGMAEAERDLNRFPESLAHMDEALQTLEFLRSKIGSLSNRASYFASVREYYEFYVDVLMQLHQLNPGQGFDAKALAIAERARARSLLDTLVEAGANLREGVSPELLSRERSLRELLDGKASRQMQILGSQHTEEQAAQVKQEIEELLIEYQQVEAEVRVKSPLYAAITQPQPLDLPQIQERVLDDDSLLLEYFLGERHSYVWAVTKTSVVSAELPGRKAIEIAAEPFYADASGRHATPRAAQELGEILLRGVAKQLGERRLVIVGDGVLQYIPFAALADPNRDQAGNQVPLVIAHEIVMLPSAAAVAVLRAQAKSRAASQTTLAVVADPVYDANDPRLLNKRAGRQGKVLPPGAETLGRDCAIGMQRLTFSYREGKTIAELVPFAHRTERYGFAANVDALADPRVSQARYLHIASHGCVNKEHAELSGVALSLIDPRGKPQAGILRLNQIYALKLATDMVVLSACETALGKDIKGEGLVGLTQGFFYAGASRVAVSLWSVNDLATAELMKKFYSGILRYGLTPPAALRAAQIEMWKEKRWQSPFYWAAFVVEGEWRRDTRSPVLSTAR